MTRQITITLDGQQKMLDLEFERRGNATAFHVVPNQYFGDNLPAGFTITAGDNEEQCLYNTQGMSERGRQIADAICRQITLLPPQFKGGIAKA